MTVGARHDTRLGQLQRGIGRGFHAALQSPRAGRDELLQCIAADPRIDPLQESRARYYAELALALGLPCDPLLRLARERDGGSLATEVLAELAARGHGRAAALLRDPWRDEAVVLGMLGYLRDFPDWAARALPMPAVQLLVERLEEQDELRFDVEVHAGFWSPFALRLPAVAGAFAAAEAIAAEEAEQAAAAAPRFADPTSLGTDALLDLLGEHASSRVGDELARRSSQQDRALLAWRVEHDDSRPRVFAAASALGAMGDLRLLELCENLFERPDDFTDRKRMLSATERQRRTALTGYFLSLPPTVTLPLARRWWPRGGHLRVVAARVLQQHAEPRDRPWLETYVQRAIETDTGLDQVLEIDALSRLGDPRSLPVLLAVAERATSSWARARALHGIAMLGHDARAQTVLTEALWDCEQEARELACHRSRLSTPAARHRAAQLASDPLEEPSVRDAARARASA